MKHCQAAQEAETRTTRKNTARKGLTGVDFFFVVLRLRLGMPALAILPATVMKDA
jgi:hypothetical protein